LRRGVAEIKLRARRRIGELSSELERAPNHHSRRIAATTKRDALKAAGLSLADAKRCERIFRVPEEPFERVIAERKGQVKIEAPGE
jgi:hypothetical protein